MTKPVKENLLDKAIATIAPGWAVERKRNRMILAMSGGGYYGSKRNRPALANYNPDIGDADSDELGDINVIRARSRDLNRNAPIATGAININVTNVIGTGLSMQPRIDFKALNLSEDDAAIWQENTLREWKFYAESKDCDITRTQNFYQLQALVFRSMLESGDVFTLLPSIDRKKPYKTCIQVIEADRISNPGKVINSDNLVEGIKLDQYGAPISYFICNKHPGAFKIIKKEEWKEVPAFGANTGRRNVIHLFERKRPGQTRGVPYLACVIEPLKQLGRYTEAELQAAVISAVFAMFIKMDSQAFLDMFDETDRKTYLSSSKQWDGTLQEADIGQPAKVVNLLPGEEPINSSPGRPNEKFDPFVQAILRQIGVALELPFEVLIKHFTSSYTAARAALLDAWRVFRRRRDFIAGDWCQPIYETWLTEAVLNGRINCPGFFSDPILKAAWCGAVWIGDGPGAIDPAKEVQAAKDRVDLTISTLEDESILHDGVDWKTKYTQRVREQKMLKDGGLLIEKTSTSNQVIDTSTQQEDN